MCSRLRLLKMKMMKGKEYLLLTIRSLCPTQALHAKVISSLYISESQPASSFSGLDMLSEFVFVCHAFNYFCPPADPQLP